MHQCAHKHLNSYCEFTIWYTNYLISLWLQFLINNEWLDQTVVSTPYIKDLSHFRLTRTGITITIIITNITPNNHIISIIYGEEGGKKTTLFTDEILKLLWKVSSVFFPSGRTPESIQQDFTYFLNWDSILTALARTPVVSMLMGWMDLSMNQLSSPFTTVDWQPLVLPASWHQLPFGGWISPSASLSVVTLGV